MATARNLTLVRAAVIVLLAGFAAAYLAVEVASIVTEDSYGDVLLTETNRRAIEVTAQTLNGNIMGSVSALGLIDRRVKLVVQDQGLPVDEEVAPELAAIGQSYKASGVFLVDPTGIIRTSWDSENKSNTGLDISFRPYFQIAMQGRQNIYAAVSLATNERSLYFAAPIYRALTAGGPVIGVVAARLNLDRVDSVLKSWTGPSLLLSPQSITFASNRPGWVGRLTAQPSAEQISAIRALKQFGQIFESGTPALLPFDIDRETVRIDGVRYALARAPVQWNDPNGEWTLVLLGDLDQALPVRWRLAIGLSSGSLVILFCGLLLVWRRRLAAVDARRRQAEDGLRANATRLERESRHKSLLAELSADLHRVTNYGDFAERLMFHIAPVLGVHYGAFYVVEENGKDLRAVGGYGVPAEALGPVPIGHGLVGQCAQNGAPVILGGATEADIRINWGEGRAAPAWIMILPVIQGNRVLGVVVLAGLLANWTEHQPLIEALLPMVGMNLEILERNIGKKDQADAIAQQQEHMKETEHWYRGIIEAAPDGILVIDEEGAIILANPTLERLFGYDRGALLGQPVEILVPDAARSGHVGRRRNFMEQGGWREMGSAGLPLMGRKKDGSLFSLTIGLASLPPSPGYGRCVSATVREVGARSSGMTSSVP